MALPFFNWSRTAASNSNADATVNWAEGQAPSSVNDSARAMMASTAAYRDDIAGAIVTAGTSTAYTVTSYEVFDTLAHMNGAMIAFTPHATNGSPATLNVDSLGAKPLRVGTSAELAAGMLVAGTPYAVTYNSSDAAFYLHGFVVNPQSDIPVGACLPYFGASSPNTYFAIPLGQAISRTTYATLFSLFGTTYGVGDASTTFNLPDLGGRVLAGKEASATRLTSTYFGGNSTTLGAVGGLESSTITSSNMLPTIVSSNAAQSITVTSNVSRVVQANNPVAASLGGSGNSGLDSTTAVGTLVSVGNNSISTTFTNASPAGHNNVQPTIVCNFILRIL